MEPKRRRTVAHFSSPGDKCHLCIDDILASFEACDVEDDIKVVREVQEIYENPILAKVLAMPENEYLKKKLSDITPEEARGLIDEFRTIPCAEATLVEYSPELTHAVSSNTAPYHLGAGKTATIAMYYLGKYFKKEAGAANTALTVLIDARDHIIEYGSQGPDADTPQHFARHVMERSVNKCDQELAGTQSASVSMGYKSFQCSDITGFVDNHCAAVRAKEICAASLMLVSVEEASCKQSDFNDEQTTDKDRNSDTDHDDDDNDSDNDENGNGGARFRRRSSNMDSVVMDSDEEDFADVPLSSSAKVYTIPKDGSTSKHVVAVSQDLNFELRGSALSILNYVEYSNMVSIEKIQRKSSR
jgi:hypothetical protein